MWSFGTFAPFLVFCTKKIWQHRLVTTTISVARMECKNRGIFSRELASYELGKVDFKSIQEPISGYSDHPIKI
jgi:hypothetical protein